MKILNARLTNPDARSSIYKTPWVRVGVTLLAFLSCTQMATPIEALYAQQNLANDGPHIVDEIRTSPLLAPNFRSVAKRVSLLEFSPDGRKLAIRNGDNQVLIFDLKRRTAIFAEGILPTFSRFEDLVFSNNGKTLFAVANSGPMGVMAWETKNLKVKWTLPSRHGSSVIFDHQGRFSILGDQLVQVNPDDGEVLIAGPKALAKADEESIDVSLQNMETAGRVQTQLILRDSILNSQPALQSLPLMPPIWQTFLERISHRPNRNFRIGIKLSPDGNCIAMADRTRIALCHPPTTKAWIHLEDDGVEALNIKDLPIENSILNFDFSPSGQLLAIGTVGKSDQSPGRLILLDTVSGNTLGTVATSPRSITAFSFSKDNQFLAVGSSSLVDDTIRIVDIDMWLRGLEEPALPAEPTTLLTNLSSPKATTSWHAAANLAQQKIPLPSSFTERLEFQQKDIDEQFQNLLAQINSEKYAQRQIAEEKLSTFGFTYPELSSRFSESIQQTAEAKYRFNKISQHISNGFQMPTQQWRMICRTLTVLEGTKNSAAQQALAQAAQHPVPSIARQARASLRVWEHRFGSTTSMSADTD